MKIAVQSTGPTLEYHVGRWANPCGYLLIIDPDTLQYIGVQNSAIALRGLASVKLLAQLLLQVGVQTVLVRNFDNNAQNVLSNAGIKVFVCTTNVVYEALEQLKQSYCSEITKRNGQR